MRVGRSEWGRLARAVRSEMDADDLDSYRWLPIMSAYEKGSPAYFATPPVNLIYAFHAALGQIVMPGVGSCLQLRSSGVEKPSGRCTRMNYSRCVASHP